MERSMTFYLIGFMVAMTFLGSTVNQRDRITNPFVFVKSSMIAFFEWIGDLGIFCGRLARVAFVSPHEGRELVRQLEAVGPKSFMLVALAGAATGAVLSLQTRDSLTRMGAGSLLPSVIVFSIITEMGPVITGLIVSGRVGAGIGAEIGSMKVTEQIDAMEASAVNPYKYLVWTRVLACVLMLPLLTLAADLFGILGGWAVNALIEPISLRLFIENGFKTLTFSDFFPPTFKTAIFGLIIGLVSSFQGMRTRGGTEGVGRSATSSVVLCSLFIILADVVLVRIIQVLFP
jgi:phospholipid/cholesterol/gamma-HCH transport system permease protein